MDPAEIDLTTSRLRQNRQLSSTIASCEWNCANKLNPNDKPGVALDDWQPLWNAEVSISTPVHVNYELCPGAGDIHFCWFNFDSMAQEFAYKPTKEPMNYRGTVGIELTTSRLMQHGQLSSTIASCHWNCVNKHNRNGMPEASLNNSQPVWNAQV